MDDDRFEVLYIDSDFELLFKIEVLKFGNFNGDGSMKGLLQDLCILLAS